MAARSVSGTNESSSSALVSSVFLSATRPSLEIRWNSPRTVNVKG